MFVQIVVGFIVQLVLRMIARMVFVVGVLLSLLQMCIR